MKGFIQFFEQKSEERKNLDALIGRLPKKHQKLLKHFDIKYTLADVFVKYTYLLNIIPNIDLNYNYIELEYTNVFSDYVPF